MGCELVGTFLLCLLPPLIIENQTLANNDSSRVSHSNVWISYFPQISFCLFWGLWKAVLLSRFGEECWWLWLFWGSLSVAWKHRALCKYLVLSLKPDKDWTLVINLFLWRYNPTLASLLVGGCKGFSTGQVFLRLINKYFYLQCDKSQRIFNRTGFFFKLINKYFYLQCDKSQLIFNRTGHNSISRFWKSSWSARYSEPAVSCVLHNSAKGFPHAALHLHLLSL